MYILYKNDLKVCFDWLLEPNKNEQQHYFAVKVFEKTRD